ncbi:hypothetical protein, partial [Spirosoma harenae]
MHYYHKRVNSFQIIVLSLLLVSSQLSFSQSIWTDQSKMLSQLRKSKADTGRVHVLLKLGNYYMLREYYLYKTGRPQSQLDSAALFAEQALQLSRSLHYENGKNEAILLRADVSIRKNKIVPALDCISSTESGQMRVKREETVLTALYSLKNMTFPSFE